ncbi:HD-GYP domain-containing protein [Cytobacillus firmus]|uniref:HD-GYP domain-containing protein n=1 Tax=Cytobacillus firmus TaxID=1399 RepID=UPI0021C7EE7C|nr:HD domain-containing phosphohydrolase [Cytobacillus firmus]
MEKINEVLLEETHNLVTALFHHCLDTYMHSFRVGDELLAFSNFLGFSNDQDIFVLGLLHDIGKIKIPYSLLNKTTPLTESEYLEIKNHAEYGENILNKIDVYPQEHAMCIKYHHENFDGSGYFGIAGKEIPLHARMIRVIDSYDTMLNGRIYQHTKCHDVVVDELLSNKGTLYDPDIVDQFIKFLSKRFTLQDAQI